MTHPFTHTEAQPGKRAVSASEVSVIVQTLEAVDRAELSAEEVQCLEHLLAFTCAYLDALEQQHPVPASPAEQQQGA